MNANRLVLNQDKSKLMIISEDNNIQQGIQIPINGLDEPLKLTRTMTYLGIETKDDLKWNFFIEDSPNNLIKELKKRLTAVRHVRNYIDFYTAKMLINGLFHSKMLYGATLWAGAPLYLKAKIQHLQLEACRIANGPQSLRWSKSRLLKSMKWSKLQLLLERASAIMTHAIINNNEPAVLAYLMNPKHSSATSPNKAPDTSPVALSKNADTCSELPIPGPDTRSPIPGIRDHRQHQPGTQVSDLKHTQVRTTRITGHLRLGTRPRNVGRTKLTRYHYRATAYKIYAKIPHEITSIKSKEKFKIWMKKFQFKNEIPKNEEKK